MPATIIGNTISTWTMDWLCPWPDRADMYTHVTGSISASVLSRMNAVLKANVGARHESAGGACDWAGRDTVAQQRRRGLRKVTEAVAGQ